MSRNRHSLAVRRQAVEHLIALCANTASSTVIEAAQDAADFLKWAAKRETLLRDLDHLERHRPEVVAIMTEFPGSSVSLAEPME